MRIGISGAGAMAREVEKILSEKISGGADYEYAGMYEPLSGKSIEEYFGSSEEGKSSEKCFGSSEEGTAGVSGSGRPDVIIDFSNPANVLSLCDYAEKEGAALVIATTGFNDEQRARIALAGMSVPVVFSANFSLGVNVVKKVVAELARVLSYDYDIEIVEKHHKRKIDAPSGTAIILADAINESGKYEFTYGRFGSSKRKPLEVGVHAVRGGGIVGEHSVIFAGDDEVIEVSHSAGSRRIFASGALKAAEFACAASAGLYDMEDVLWGEK